MAREFEASANAIRKWVKQTGLDEGLRSDGLTTDERSLNGDWNTVWEAKVTRTDQGWFAEIAIPFKVNGKSNFQGGTHLGVEGTVVIDRRDFGMSWSATLDNGGLVVGNDVTIELNIEAVKK